ncbi:unnamed protein product [Commensalibacter communis]|uniref:hypothetical protein n=1 Tax=Commensalibacter communis TaxID=2972786 RepID=UPI0022FF6BA3|nr:hypothetical protein [Commensalibacter communis]CAI3952536.1 unnamed protein product [Commensalibacter communis]
MRLLNIVFATALFGAVFSLEAAQNASANIADDLNVNYNKIVEDCGTANRPAFLCSGSLIRFTSTNKKYHTWDPSPYSIGTGGVSFMYIRKDIPVQLFFQGKTSGILYYPSMLKPSSKGRAEVACAFPTDAWTGGRSNSGCGRPDNNNMCQDMGINTEDAWYKDFMSRPYNPPDVSTRLQYQCAFDMRIGVQNTAAAFNENLKAIKMHTDIGYGYNEIMIKTPPTDGGGHVISPEKLPIQAFFYTVQYGRSGLEDAQYFQRDFYNVTARVVPIVKVNIDDPQNISFSYNEEDRAVTIAEQLNSNLVDTVDNCGSETSPSYECSGTLLRQTSYKSRVWDPNAASIEKGGESFFYLRRDIKVRRLLHSGRNSGFIYYPLKQAPQGINNARITCSFPTMGWSDGRGDGRCGAYARFPQTSIQCQRQGIYTAEDWYKKFSDPTINGDDKFASQCAFDVVNFQDNMATAFSESIKAHNMAYSNNTSKGSGSNEVIVRTPETDGNGHVINPEKLPIQAFFYQNETGLNEAQAYQKDYYKVTGRIVPVVYMNTTNFNNIVFYFITADQAVNKGADIAKELNGFYNKVFDCGGEDSPTFACSGNIIRFTNYSKDFRVWDPSPPAVGRKGVSFMYIRKDLPLDKAFKNNTSGIVYYPTQRMPVYKEASSVRCVFPVDGYSDRRYTNGQNDACGTNINYPNDSKPCQEQGITTADAWYNHFSSIPDIDKNRLNHQCGFNLIDQHDKTSVFQAVLDGQKRLQKERGGANYNELVLTIPAYKAVNTVNGISYQIENPKVLPIEAFFYTNESGLTEARGYQQDYHDTVGVDVPIVKFDLDITTGQVAYSYNKTDQTDVYNQSN